MSASDFIKLSDDGATATITLSRPVTIDGAKVTTVTMREPTVRDSEAHAERRGGDVAKEVFLFAALCNVDPEVIRSLPIRDKLRLDAAFGLFTD